jgi:hypothetical protein
MVSLDSPIGLLVRPERALKQQEAELAHGPDLRPSVTPADIGGPAGPEAPVEARKARRFHGTVALEPTRVGRDAGRIADEVVSHLAGLVSAKLTVTLEIEADIPAGVPDHVVRTVTENARTLKFKNPGLRNSVTRPPPA